MTRWTPEQINAAFDRCHAATGHGTLVPDRIAELTAERDRAHAAVLWLTGRVNQLRAELAPLEQRNAFLADQNAKLFREVQALRGRLTAFVDPDHQPYAIADPVRCAPTVAAPFPARALRQQRQPIGLLTAPRGARP
jgi:hypothetical protein